MNWQNLLSPARLGSTKNYVEFARSPYHKDYDRIIFSHSFRQLNRKTQVHPLTNSDGIHTRLTHSLEVSCIGRSLAMMAGEKMQDSSPSIFPKGVGAADIGVIVQAACLAHDIGNPPFGHAGEYAIRDWFNQPEQAYLLNNLTAAQRRDICQFEGNAQGFRILTHTEYHPNAGGMRLTCATLGAFLKYPWLAKPATNSGFEGAAAGDGSAQKPANTLEKFGCYSAELDILKQVADELGLKQTSDTSFVRHPLTYLVEAADDICYALIDLEDGIQLGMLDYRDVEPLFLDIIGDLGVPEELTQDARKSQKLAALRGRAMKRLVDDVSTVFVALQGTLLAGEHIGHLLDHCGKTLHTSISAAKTLARDLIFNHPDKARLELIANHSLCVLLDAFMPLALPEEHTSFKEQRLNTLLMHKGVVLGQDVYQNLMTLLDMLSNLSDHQAYILSQELQGRQVLSA